MSKRIDITGQVFGDLEAIEFIGTKNSHALWKVKCLKCGGFGEATYINLKSGNSTGCQSCKGRKLTKKQEAEIRERYAIGLMSMGDLADDYKVGRTTIYRIIHEKIDNLK